MGALFNAPTVRNALSGMIPVWDAKINQWVPTNAAKVYVNGVVQKYPVTQGQATTITSTGAFSPYTINFPTPFTTSPVVTATSAVSSGGNFTLVNITAVTSSGFTFSIMGFAPGQIAIPAAQTVVIEYIAIGT